MLDHQEHLDQIFRALGDPTRRQMIHRLCQGPASVSELARPLTMSLAAVVQHVQVLESSGLVSTEKVGRVRTCRIDAPALRIAQRWVDEHYATRERRLDRLGVGRHLDHLARVRSDDCGTAEQENP
ncbi:metalloregulator ArsR/SmtB family transcription factor [soil metagenome]